MQLAAEPEGVAIASPGFDGAAIISSKIAEGTGRFILDGAKSVFSGLFEDLVKLLVRTSVFSAKQV